jgi:AcrR family transcriptional regulator
MPAPGRQYPGTHLCHTFRVPRKYTLKRRAERQERTRQRIVEATVALHGDVGPARTTISAIAERAGVQRHTVYRYFPDEATLFNACSAHYRAAHPLPNPAQWLEIADPEARLRVGLAASYAYYRENEAMMSRVLRDAELVPVGGGFLRYQEEAIRALAQGWKPRGVRREQLEAMLGVAVSFQTWRTLSRRFGLGDAEAVELMVAMVTGAIRAGGLLPTDREAAATST